jgi:hypothetical protein
MRRVVYALSVMMVVVFGAVNTGEFANGSSPNAVDYGRRAHGACVSGESSDSQLLAARYHLRNRTRNFFNRAAKRPDAVV